MDGTNIIKNNEIVNLSQKAFQGLSKIKILNLHGNKISHIEKVHLDGVRSSLQNLDLSNNLIGEINNDILKGMSNLKILDLTNNQIYVIENFAFELLSLDKLSLKGNNLTHIWRTY
jgi:Leucine-rich repeat (LRR) protein